MRKLLLVLFLCSSSLQANAENPFAQGDAMMGKAMVEKNCVNCHASKFGGDGTSIYTRKDRKVNSSSQLITQIRNCNTMLGLKWFEDEELHVANYLNQTYYKFEK